MPASQRYTQEAVERALGVVSSKQMSLRKASQVFGIPYATLGDKLRGRRPVIASPRTVLTSEEETKLVNWMTELSKRGFGRTRTDLRDMVKRILDDRGKKTVFKDNRPGKAWIAAFFKRHPELSERMSQALGKERALVTRESMKSWFEEMKLNIDAVDPTILTSPDRLFNADESGFTICPKTKKVISMTGTKHVYSVTSGSRQQVTVLACISAIGQYLPPLLIFPYSRDPRFNAMEGFEEAFFQRTPNGWITEEVFLSFLKDIFLPFLQGKRPVVLFVDGHSSHHSLAISNLCSENGVVLYCLKAHASHLIQPLDQSFFGAIKPAWTEEVRKHAYDTGDSVTMKTFAGVLKKAWTATARPEHAFKSFAKSGLFPFNPDIVLDNDKLKPSCSFQNTAPSETVTAPALCTPPSCPSATAAPSTSSTEDMEPQPSTSTALDPQTIDTNLVCTPSLTPTTQFECLSELMEFNIVLGEDKVRLFIQTLKEQNHLEEPDYTRWTALVDSVLSAKEKEPSVQCQSMPLLQQSTQETPANKSFDHFLTLPTFQRKKGVKRAQAPLPSSISGTEYKEMVYQKKRKQEEEEKKKEERKRQREEKKKVKAAEAAEKKRRQEEKNREREQQKREKEEKKKRKIEEKKLNALLASTTQRESESSDSGEEPVFDDTSDFCEDITDICKCCKLDTKGQTRIQCKLCDQYLHTQCVVNSDLKDCTEADLLAMDIEFFCDFCLAGIVG